MLTVFPESFDRTATAAVWKVGEGEARYKLDAIVKRSLLLYDPEKDRYRLHDSVHPVARYFIDGRIRKSNPARQPNFLVEAAARHAAHYETVLRTADRLYQQGDEELERGLEQFDFEWRNIQVGQAWAENHSKENDKAAELCSAYADAGVSLLGLRRHPTEQIGWFEAALTATRRLNDPGGEIAHLGNMASLYTDLGKTSRAIELYQRRLEIARDIGNRQDESKIMSDLGLAYATLGETNRAIEIYEQALAIDREMNNRQGERAILTNLGNAYFTSSEFHRAVEVYQQALAIASELGDRQGEGETLSNMGYAHATLGQASQAIKFYEQSLPLLRKSGDR
ncbi:MAG: tetratricopeptide repeat protein, partial [Deltaproteobacteria bacterium]|nr:tetratricopeptide repeat protein [Deltaproteobacteria bacterium]